MENKGYTKPEMEIIKIIQEDIVTASTELGPETVLPEDSW